MALFEINGLYGAEYDRKINYKCCVGKDVKGGAWIISRYYNGIRVERLRT
jgi:hypothetical protein